MNEIDAARIYKVLQKKLELPYSHKRATVFYFSESEALKKSHVDFCAAPILNIEHFHEVPSTALSFSRYERIPPLMIVFLQYQLKDLSIVLNIQN